MVMLKLEEQPLLIQAIFNGAVDEVRNLLPFKPDVNYQDAEKRSALHAAAYKGDRDLAELLIGEGARVNTKDANWLTPLHRACGVCADDTVELLLKYKADTTARDRQWQTPLHIAAAHNAIGCIQHLLGHITNVNVTDRSGCTALHHAALNGHNEVVELLLARGSIVNACDKKDCRPIHWAAHLGHVDTVGILVQRGADINVKDRNQYTPLHAAVASGMVYVCGLLLNAGADVNAQNAFGNTPLHIACLNGHLSVCQMLLAHDANLEAANYKGQTPLHIAAASTQGVGCLAYLLEQERVDINRQSADGRTPLHMSAIYGRFTRSKRLIDKGAVVDRADKNGNTALHIAAQYGHDILTATLLDFGADPLKRGYEGRTPLHVCCLSGYVEVCRKFLQRDVDLNVVDDHGRTPIHCAAYKGSVECLDLLVSRGADFQLQDDIGRAPLHYAAARGHYNCVYTLVGIGAPVGVVDGEGCCALHLAAAFDGEARCVEYLLAHKAQPLAADVGGFTPVHYAVNGSNRMSLELLLKSVGKHAGFLEAGMPETTPLHLAARRGDLNILRLIMPYFPDPNVRTKEGYTPLLVAAREGHTANVQMLLRYGAKVAICDELSMSPVHHAAKNGHQHCLALLVDNTEVKSVIDRQDAFQRTALMLAISGSHQDCALTLLKSDSDPNIVDADRHSSIFRAVVTDQNSVVQLLVSCGARLTEPDVNGKTVLHLAAACGHLKCLQRIVQSVDDEQALVLDKHGFGALHWACYYGNAGCLEYLLHRNIFHKLDGNVFTPVHCAAFTGSERCLELLHTKFGVECLRARDVRNRTPLHLAAWHGHADCVRFLLDNGGEVEARDEIGRSPLISAAQNGQSQVIDLLLAHKADLKASDASGSTALHVACLRKHNHTALLLLEYINDAEVINMVDSEKKTALHLSARNGLVEVTAELIKKGASVIAADNNGLTPALYCAPNACVAQCLAIILAHHPTEMSVGLHTKECMRSVITTLSRTSQRCQLATQASQTHISLLRDPRELFLENFPTFPKHRRRRAPRCVVPPLPLDAPTCAPSRRTHVLFAGASRRHEKAKLCRNPRAKDDGPASKEADRLVLIEDFETDEAAFDVSNLKSERGLGLHRSYSEMALASAEAERPRAGHVKERAVSKPARGRDEDADEKDDDDDDDGRADLRETTYRRLVDGYKNIALKMARVSNKFDVPADVIHRKFVEQQRERAGNRCQLGKASASCPILIPRASMGGSDVADVESRRAEEQEERILDETLSDFAEVPAGREERASGGKRDEKMFMPDDVDAKVAGAEEPRCADRSEPAAERDVLVPRKTATSDYVTCSLPPCSVPLTGPTPQDLVFATYEYTVPPNVVLYNDEVEGDAVDGDDYPQDPPDPPKSYCDCEYVCNNCVLLNRYDFEEEAERGLRFSFKDDECGACRRDDRPDDDDKELIPLENLLEPDAKVFIGEGAIKKACQLPEERGHPQHEAKATPEKIKALSERCESEKLRRRHSARKSQEHADKAEADADADDIGQQLQIEELDQLEIAFGSLDNLPFSAQDYIDIASRDGEVDVVWPKVTYDEGRVRIPRDVDAGGTRAESGQDKVVDDLGEDIDIDEERPTRDMDWGVDVDADCDDLDDAQLGAIGSAHLKASESMTNVIGAHARLDGDDAGVEVGVGVGGGGGLGLSCVTSCTCIRGPLPRKRDFSGVRIEDVLEQDEEYVRRVKKVQVEDRRERKEKRCKQADGLTALTPPGAITTLASSFAPSGASTHQGSSEAPASLSAASDVSPSGLHFKASSKLLKDSVAIVDFSTLFSKARKKNDAGDSTSESSASNSESSEGGGEDLVREKDLLKMIHHAHDKIKKCSYQEMVDLSEGLNMTREAKAMARKLIDQFARKQKQQQQQPPQAQAAVVPEPGDGDERLESKSSDHGSDSGVESLNTSSLESMPSVPSLTSVPSGLFWDVMAPPTDPKFLDGREDNESEAEEDKSAGEPKKASGKKEKRSKRQDDNKCRLQ